MALQWNFLEGKHKYAVPGLVPLVNHDLAQLSRSSTSTLLEGTHLQTAPQQLRQLLGPR